jgi:cellobiose-specific phosphotransferase system component IIB
MNIIAYIFTAFLLVSIVQASEVTDPVIDSQSYKDAVKTTADIILLEEQLNYLEKEYNSIVDSAAKVLITEEIKFLTDKINELISQKNYNLLKSVVEGLNFNTSDATQHREIIYQVGRYKRELERRALRIDINRFRSQQIK